VTHDIDDFDAVVYDLDGTLVHLEVDWDEVAREAAARFAAAGVDADGADLWAMLDLADEHGLRDEVESVLAAYERQGAKESVRLDSADCVPDSSVPVGVCSLNAEDACRVALDVHGLSEFVNVVVGRDSVPTRKPDPEPLLAVVRRLGATPERTLFVGDTERDAVTAERAGTAFAYAEGGPRDV
jgi:phosphoglycolate phosphatase